VAARILRRTGKILLAAMPDMLERFQRILVRHEPIHVATARDALRALDDLEHFKMVILSVHFDESQMLSRSKDWITPWRRCGRTASWTCTTSRTTTKPTAESAGSWTT
jgi:hypothetical protein